MNAEEQFKLALSITNSELTRDYECRLLESTDFGFAMDHIFDTYITENNIEFADEQEKYEFLDYFYDNIQLEISF